MRPAGARKPPGEINIFIVGKELLIKGWLIEHG
jgi:hypothetical protein